jgi:outer membrane putative beta-barrel porin/alpha-amylase
MRRTSKLRPKLTALLITLISAIVLSASASAKSHRPQQEQSTQPPCADEPDLINADRPGIADGSTVIGAKTFQIESGIQQEFRRSGDSREHTFFVPTLLRFGVNDHGEVRIEGNTFTRVSTSDSTELTSGFAPLSLGFKYQIYESKSCRQFSLGTIGRVFPTWGSKDFRTQHTTGDIRLAADWDFAPKLSLNPNVGIARYEDDQGRSFTAGLFAITLNYLPKKRLNPFVDVGVQAPEAKYGPAAAILDGGVALIIGQNLQVDAEAGTRVHGDTGPHPFLSVGISWRARMAHPGK